MLKDLSFAWRTLRAKPIFTAVAVVSLALGIGANTAIFSVIESSLLRGLPYKNAEQLVSVQATLPQMGHVDLSPGEFLDYQQQTRALSGLAVFANVPFTLTAQAEAQQFAGMVVTTNFFDVLGATAERGRLISPKIDKPNTETRVAVIADSVWRSVFGSDPKIVGRDIALSGKLFRIVGVLSPKQDYPDGYQIWVSPRLPVPQHGQGENFKQLSGTYGEHWLGAIARVKPAFTLKQAQAEAAVIFKNIDTQHPMARHDGCVLHPLQDTMVSSLRPALWVLLGAVILLLLIACANLSGLLLGRATGRTREIAVRLALGATRAEILRLMLSETLLLAVGGGVCGVILAAVGLQLIAHYSPYRLPAALAPELNLPVLSFCVFAALLSAILSGLLPALYSSKTDVNTGLKEGAKGTASHNTHRLRTLLTSGEIALSVVLLIGAGVLIHSFAKLISVDPGFDPNHAMTARLALPDTRYRSNAQRTTFWNRLLSRVSAMPGVKAAGLLTTFPFSDAMNSSLIRIEGQHLSSITEGMRIYDFGVSPQTLQALGVPLLAGRFIDEKDTAGAPIVNVISKRFADIAFPNENPIGKRYNVGQTSGWITVVGVVGNVTFDDLSEAPEADAYYSFQQFAPPSSGLVLRGSPSMQDFRHIVHNLDANIPLTDVKPLGEYLGQSLAARKFLLGLLTTFSALAILLAAIGLYAVLAYSVQQRKQEIGVRIALGATSSNVLWLILRECLTIAVIGTAVGLLGATWATSFLKFMLYGITATDLTAYIAAVILILTVAIAASLAPAIRATRIDPLSALRYE